MAKAFELEGGIDFAVKSDHFIGGSVAAKWTSLVNKASREKLTTSVMAYLGKELVGPLALPLHFSGVMKGFLESSRRGFQSLSTPLENKFKNAVERKFSKAGGGYGYGTWPPLAAITKSKRKAGESLVPLVKTGALKRASREGYSLEHLGLFKMKGKEAAKFDPATDTLKVDIAPDVVFAYKDSNLPPGYWKGSLSTWGNLILSHMRGSGDNPKRQIPLTNAQFLKFVWGPFLKDFTKLIRPIRERAGRNIRQPDAWTMGFVRKNFPKWFGSHPEVKRAIPRFKVSRSELVSMMRPFLAMSSRELKENLKWAVDALKSATKMPDIMIGPYEEGRKK